jgi:lysophospholipase L1-like esterase
VRFLALGDSYTIGEGVAEADRWPSLLEALLRTRGVRVETELVARTAWTSDELADAIVAARPQGPFDLVSLMIGVNDQYRGRSLEQFASNVEPLFRTAIALAGGDPGRVLLISIPDWGFTPFAAGRDRTQISRELDGYNAWLHGCAAAAGARWVDVTPLSRAMLDDPSLAASDGLHPGPEIHRRWVKVIEPEAVRILSLSDTPASP